MDEQEQSIKRFWPMLGLMCMESSSPLWKVSRDKENGRMRLNWYGVAIGSPIKCSSVKGKSPPYQKTRIFRQRSNVGLLTNRFSARYCARYFFQWSVPGTGGPKENLLKEEERPLSERDEVIVAVKAVASSDLWKRIQKAEETLVEAPFSLKIEDEELPRIISGAIDLIFKEPDGWVITDYKTDKVDGNLDNLVAYYRSQVEMYKDFWEKMSGEKIKEAGLYFVDTGKWIAV